MPRTPSGPPVPAAVPVLPVRDVVRSTAWYTRLGFTLRVAYDGYAILAFGGAEVHLAEVDLAPDAETWSGAYLRVADAAVEHARWDQLGAPTVAPLTDQPYGIREFATEDLDGNLWRVGSPVPGGPLDGWVPDDGPWPDEAPATIAGEPAGSEPTGDDPQGEERPPSDHAGGDGGAGTDDERWYDLVSGDGRCGGCGMQFDDTPSRALGATVREEVYAFGLFLADADDAALRRRPDPETWSALEYAVHVRDLLRVFADRVVLTLRQDGPELGWWDHEAAMADGLANEADVGAVVDDLARNSSHLSEALRAVADDEFERPATRRGTEPFTIDLLGRYALHEVVHHHADARRVAGTG